MNFIEEHLPQFDCRYIIPFNEKSKMNEFLIELNTIINIDQINQRNMILRNTLHDEGYENNDHYVELIYKDKMTFDHRLVTAINWLFSPFDRRKVKYKKLLSEYSMYIEKCFIEIACYENPKAELLRAELCVYDKAFKTIRSFNTELYISYYREF